MFQKVWESTALQKHKKIKYLFHKVWEPHAKNSKKSLILESHWKIKLKRKILIAIRMKFNYHIEKLSPWLPLYIPAPRWIQCRQLCIHESLVSCKLNYVYRELKRNCEQLSRNVHSVKRRWYKWPRGREKKRIDDHNSLYKTALL